MPALFDLPENETHGSIVHRAFYNNLEHLYLRWRLTSKQIEAMTFEQLKEHCSKLSERYGYEMSAPTPTEIQKTYQLIQARQLKEAAELSKAILEQNPDLSEAHYLFGLSSLANGMFKPAIENFEMAIKKIGADKFNLQNYKQYLATATKILNDANKEGR